MAIISASQPHSLETPRSMITTQRTTTKIVRTIVTTNSLIHATGYQGSSLRYAGLPPAGAHVLDSRLSLINQLAPEIFRGAKTLDIGCNRGAVSVQLGTMQT